MYALGGVGHRRAGALAGPRPGGREAALRLGRRRAGRLQQRARRPADPRRVPHRHRPRRPGRRTSSWATSPHRCRSTRACRSSGRASGAATEAADPGSPTSGRTEAPADPQLGPADLFDLLADAVAIRTVADVPVGVFLSGGIDSTIIAALAARAGDHPHLHGHLRRDSHDESVHAERVARALGTVHTELPVDAADGLAPGPGDPAGSTASPSATRRRSPPTSSPPRRRARSASPSPATAATSSSAATTAWSPGPGSTASGDRCLRAVRRHATVPSTSSTPHGSSASPPRPAAASGGARARTWPTSSPRPRRCSAPRRRRRRSSPSWPCGPTPAPSASAARPSTSGSAPVPSATSCSASTDAGPCPSRCSPRSTGRRCAARSRPGHRCSTRGWSPWPRRPRSTNTSATAWASSSCGPSCPASWTRRCSTGRRWASTRPTARGCAGRCGPGPTSCSRPTRCRRRGIGGGRRRHRGVEAPPRRGQRPRRPPLDGPPVPAVARRRAPRAAGAGTRGAQRAPAGQGPRRPTSGARRRAGDRPPPGVLDAERPRRRAVRAAAAVEARGEPVRDLTGVGGDQRRRAGRVPTPSSAGASRVRAQSGRRCGPSTPPPTPTTRARASSARLTLHAVDELARRGRRLRVQHAERPEPPRLPQDGLAARGAGPAVGPAGVGRRAARDRARPGSGRALGRADRRRACLRPRPSPTTPRHRRCWPASVPARGPAAPHRPVAGVPALALPRGASSATAS